MAMFSSAPSHVQGGAEEESSLLEASSQGRGLPSWAPGTRKVAARWVLTLGFVVGFLLVLVLHRANELERGDGLKDAESKQAVTAPEIGGTLLPGPGCPEVCGSFVECSLDRRSKNNLIDLQFFADLNDRFGLAYDTTMGQISLHPVLVLRFTASRLANKQLVARIPEFQCPNSTCFIPNAYLNDDFCDCPGTCADEDFHSCDECGTEVSPFSERSNVCPDQRCADPTLDGFLNQQCLGPGVVTTPFVCPETPGAPSCTIDQSLVDNLQCDCPGTCADESDYTCENCSCLPYCGVPSPWGCVPFAGIFNCPTVPQLGNTPCSIPDFLHNNGICDCPFTCADEDPIQTYFSPDLPATGQDFPVNCEVCLCPTACGQFYYYFADSFRLDPGTRGQGGQTCMETQYYSSLPRFQCPPPGNCSLPMSFVNDDTCDCPGTCADEDRWDCDTCACPRVCGQRNRNCFDVYFQCPESACTISVFSLNDGSCDCPGCTDEEGWTCETCVNGCPTNETCHIDFPFPCEHLIFTCPDEQLAGSPPCKIPASYLNDGFCDCPACSDEESWDCSNCSAGCRLCENPFDIFGRYERHYNRQRPMNCLGEEFSLDFPVQCPGYPAESGEAAVPLGCEITFRQVNDDRCDCASCRDESLENCGNGICSSSRFCSVAGVNSLVCPCPNTCGESTNCLGKCTGDPLLYGTGLPTNFAPQQPPECVFYCPGDICGKHVQRLNDSVCDCVNCEDEATWTCSTCQCPALELDFLQFNSQGCGFTPLDKVLQGKGLLDVVLQEKSFRCTFPRPPDPPTLPPDPPPTLPPDPPTLPPGPPFKRQLEAGPLQGSVEEKLWERSQRQPRDGQSNSPEAVLDDLIRRTLADESVRKALKAAVDSGFTLTTLQAEMHAVATKVGLTAQRHRTFDLLYSGLKDPRLQKLSKAFVSDGYSPEVEQELRHFVLKKAMGGELQDPGLKAAEMMRGLVPQVPQGPPPSRSPGVPGVPGPPRRLQGFEESFKPLLRFDCPGTQCFIPPYAVNNRICDCPGCEDEEAFTCESCIPTVPLGSQTDPAQTNIGVAVGVSLGVAVGVGLGVGLGVSAALSGVFAAVGTVHFSVANAQEFVNNPQVQQGLKNAFIRLAGVNVAADAVTLNWACAGEALAQLGKTLRRMAEEVRLCFEIEIEGEQPSLEACEVLTSTSTFGASEIIREELQKVSSEDVQVVEWNPHPNPLSRHPGAVSSSPGTAFAPPEAVHFDPPGALDLAPAVAPKAALPGARPVTVGGLVAQPAPAK